MNIIELEKYLFQLSEFLKARNLQFEITIVGGGAILLNHRFNMQTVDVDIIGPQDDVFKQAIEEVANKNQIEKEWMNTDFVLTSSYSKAIESEAVFYENYNDSLIINTIPDDIIITMKLKAYREYKHDRTDIILLMNENPNITVQQIENNCIKLYGDIRKISKRAWNFLDRVTKREVDLSSNIKEEIEANELLHIYMNNFNFTMHNRKWGR